MEENTQNQPIQNANQPQVQPKATPVTDPPLKQAEQPAPKQKRSPVTIILIFTIFLLILVIGYLVYQNNQLKMQEPEKSVATPTASLEPTSTATPDPTANWEVYKSSIYQVKYPNSYTSTEEDGGILHLSMWGPTQTEGTELFDGAAITFQPREIPDTTLVSWVNLKIDAINKDELSTLLGDPDPISINGYNGFTYTTEGLGTYKHIILESKDKIMFIEIDVITSDPGDLGFSETVDSILSTFEFLE